MNLFKTEAGNDHCDGNSDNSHQLLREIEEISKALYLQKPPPKSSVSQHDNQSKSVERSRFIGPKGPGILNDNAVHKNKKLSLLWNWKKPLKALVHIRHHSFDICFFLHVHSIEGLPANFDGATLCVHWKRKDEVLQTRPSRVLQGISDFEESLMYKCHVYGSRTGAHNSAKYEEKLFLIRASVVGAPGVDIGKHWVDLTRLLPLTLEELEGEKSSGKWTTSFKLAGKAKGASLNVSFGFSVMKDNLVESKNDMTVYELNLTHNRSATLESGISLGSKNGNKMLRRTGSVPSNLNYRPSNSSTSVDVMVYEDISPVLGLKLSKSINFLYEKLNEGNLHDSEEFGLSSEHVEPPMDNLDSESTKDISESESDCSEFIVIERGIEIPEDKQLESKQSTVCTIDGSAIETINVDEMIKDDNLALDEEMECVSKENTICSCSAEVMVNDSKHEESGLCATGTGSMEELQSAFNGLLMSELADLDSSSAADEFLQNQDHMEVKSNYRACKLSKKSLSLDDVTESVASEFLNMQGMEHPPFVSSSDDDPESPRERLLREFQKESLASGNFILGFDTREDKVECSCTPTGSVCGDSYNDFDVFPPIQCAKEDNKREGLLLKKRRLSNMLEDLETESLMQEWGLNENAFQRSPHHQFAGFGSPIELPTEDPFELPPLADGFGPLIQLKSGSYLRSMNPSPFKCAKNAVCLIMHVSRPVVLPAEMGYDIIDVGKNAQRTNVNLFAELINKFIFYFIFVCI